MQGTEKTLEVSNYTFHRHSAPKHIVYYRCSDKRCRARLHFNLQTKQITMKHSHLDPSIHQTPRFTKTITVDELATIPQTKRGGRHTPAPVRTTEALMRLDADLECREEFSLPMKRQRFITIVNPPSTDVYLLRFSVNDPQRAEYFCQAIVQNGTANRALHHSEGSAFWLLNGAVSKSPQAGVIECEVPAHQFEIARDMIRRTFGSDMPLSTFRHA